MIKIENLEFGPSPRGKTIIYSGKRSYIIKQILNGRFSIAVIEHDGNGEPDLADRFSCASLSSAIEIVENLENEAEDEAE